MTDSLTQPHDKFFRETFSRLEVARDFVKYYLPPQIASLLNLDTLEISKDSFIDAELKEHFSDLLYQINLVNGQPLYIYLLFDHKSYPDSFVSLQLLDYQLRIWELVRKQQQSARKEQPRGQKETFFLPPIFPLVLYHGEEKWQVSTELVALFGSLPNELRPYIPNYNYWLCDLSTYHDEDIKGYAILQIGLLSLKYIYNDRFGEKLAELLRLLNQIEDRPTALSYIEVMLRYASNAARHLTPNQLHTTLNDLFSPEEEGNLMATLAEQWMEQGRLEAEKQFTEKMQQLLQQTTEKTQQAMEKAQQATETAQQQSQKAQQIAEKARQMAIKNICQTIAIRFAAPLDNYTLRLQPLELTVLEQLNELAFTSPTQAEFEAALPPIEMA